MRTYELMVIFSPHLSDAEAAERLAGVKKIIAGGKGEILSEDWLGRRKFAHPMEKNRDGFYAYLKAKCEPSSVKEIKRALKLEESVLRAEIIRSAAKETVSVK